MDGRRSSTVGQVFELGQVPRIQPTVQARETLERLVPWQVITFMTMWGAVMFIGGAIEPAPANPNAAPVLGAVLATLFLVGSAATALLALSKTRLPTARASLFTGGVALIMTITCPLVGHHHLAPWWFAQLLVVTVPTGWSLQQLLTARSQSRYSAR
jgi:drug/metabolite transporter (DMT)-like permease